MQNILILATCVTFWDYGSVIWLLKSTRYEQHTPLCNAQHYDLCKLQECIFNKENGTVTMMGARFLQRFTIGYNKKSIMKRLLV